VTGSDDDATLVGTHDHRVTGDVAKPELRITRGDAIGRYIAVQPIGRGANGIVWSAYDSDLDRKVAIKLLAQPIDERGDRRQQLLAEAQAMAKIHHPNVVAVYDVGTHAGHLYIAMEFVEGTTLGRWCKDTTRTQAEILDAYTAAARGLADAHRAGVVHRDFKPDNVLVDRDDRVRVADFGLAAPTPTGDAGRRRPKEHAASGTPAYMSPEHHAGTVNAQSDQFSFCVALCEALTSRRPFVGATLAELAAATVGGALDPGVVRRLPSRVRGVVLRGLSSMPADRHASMDALALELERARRPRWPWMLAAVGAVAILGGAWAVFEPAASVGDCVRGADRIAAVWTKTQRSQIRVARGEYTEAYAASVAEHLGSELDAYAKRWADLHDRTCAADHGVPASDATAVTRRACVEDRFASFTGAAGLVTTREIDVDATYRLLEVLPDPAECERVDVVAWEPVPADPELAAQVASIRDRLRDVKLRHAAGEVTTAVDDANAIVAAAREAAYPHLVATALVELASFDDDAGHTDDARRHLDEAMELALAAGHDWLAATVAIERIEFVAHNPSHDRGDEISERLARAMIERSGASDRLAARFQTALGGLAFTRTDFLSALEHHEAALATYLRTPEPSERAIGFAHLHCAVALAQLNRPEEAFARAAQARRMVEAVGGPGDRDLVNTMQLFAVIEASLGRTTAAIARFEEALAGAQALYGPRSRLVSTITFNMTLVQSSRGLVAQARESLERSRQAWPVVGDLYADGEFELAEHTIDYYAGDAAAALAHIDRALALWSAAGDTHARAIASARLARARVLVVVGEHAAALAILEAEYLQWGPSLLAEPDDVIDGVIAARATGNPDVLALWLARSEASLATDEPGAALRSFARALAWEHPDTATVQTVRDARAQLALAFFGAHPRIRQIDAWLESVGQPVATR
jgi:tRNA A-37 threonylcarbamoyl transferase component Bud32/tetratricopeptide (TPR) repeat protein